MANNESGITRRDGKSVGSVKGNAEDTIEFVCHLCGGEIIKGEVHVCKRELPSTVERSDITDIGVHGCFIATAAYGSEIDPELDYLRAFRDSFLLKHRLGRAFVKVYYKISPPIACFVRGKSAIRRVTRIFLRPFSFPV